MNIKNILTTAATAFAGGAMGYVGTLTPDTLLDLPHQWKAIVGGMLVAGAGAVYHLYQPKPVAS